MQHALAIPDPALAEQFLLHMTGTSRVVTYLGWLRQISAEIVCQLAYLCVSGGWAHVLTNQAEAAVRYARASEAALPAYRAFTNMSEGRAISREEVAGNLATIRFYADRLLGNLPAAIAPEAVDRADGGGA